MDVVSAVRGLPPKLPSRDSARSTVDSNSPADSDRLPDPQRTRQALLKQLFGPHIPSSIPMQLLRTGDVALLFHVSERTVSEWARRGRIPSVRTPGGQRRYPVEPILSLLEGEGPVANGDVPGVVPA